MFFYRRHVSSKAEKWIGKLPREREILLNLTDKFEVLTTTRLHWDFEPEAFIPESYSFNQEETSVLIHGCIYICLVGLVCDNKASI